MPDDMLIRLGWSPKWEALFAPYAEEGLAPGRVLKAGRGSAVVATSEGPLRAKPSARFLKSLSGTAGRPAVGDWVAVHAPEDIDVPLIEAVLDRTSAIARGDAGESSDVQVLAANVDVVFIVHPVADAPNLRRLERELSLAWESGAVPVVVLTKGDLSADAESARSAVESIAFGVDVHVTNAPAGTGLEPVRDRVAAGATAVLIGPSGAGKSTIVNALLGEERQATREVRANDGRGRHTTVTRELIELPGGGLLIDTPGLRALRLTGSEAGIASAFPEIEEAAASCRFADCTHTGEPGCGVAGAVESGAIPAERLASYHKLLREAQVEAMKTDARLRADEQRKWKTIGKAVKEFYKTSDKRGGKGGGR